MGGMSLKQILVKPDLTGCFWKDCWLYECGVKGASHTRASVHYGGRCFECDKQNITAQYDGDSGKSAYYRTKQHRNAIENANTKNAFAKHSQIYHPERLKDPSIYEVWSKSTHPGKTLDRQIKEGHFIATSKANILMNSRTEWHQPSVNRVTATREVRETNSGRGRGRVRGS